MSGKPGFAQFEPNDVIPYRYQRLLILLNNKKKENLDQYICKKNISMSCTIATVHQNHPMIKIKISIYCNLKKKEIKFHKKNFT